MVFLAWFDPVVLCVSLELKEEEEVDVAEGEVEPPELSVEEVVAVVEEEEKRWS